MARLLLGPGASLLPEARAALEAAALEAAGRGGVARGGVARGGPRGGHAATGGHGEAEAGVPRPPTQPRAGARAGSEEERCAHVDAAHPDKAAYARCTWLWLDLAHISLEQGRPHHAIAHARRIVGPGAVSPFATDAGAARVSGRLVSLRPGDSVTDAVGRRQGGAARPAGLHVLSRAYEALNGRPGGEGGGRGGSTSGGPTMQSATPLLEAARLGHAAAQVDLPTSPHISPHLPTSPHISPHLPGGSRRASRGGGGGHRAGP